MIKEIIERLNRELPATVRLVAVSKFHPFEAIEQAYEAGQRIFAESRPQELLAKVRRLEEVRSDKVANAVASGEDVEEANAYMADVEWHFIGHLQTNKLKMVLPYVTLVQSVDSLRLLDAIQTWGKANDRVIPVLLEPHVAAEETKQGFSAEEIYAILRDALRGSYPNIRFRGIMGMATFTDDESLVRADFAALRGIFEAGCSLIRNVYENQAGNQSQHSFSNCMESDFNELSIGMSDDFPIAIEYGSTMVRIGSMIFGNRS